MIDILKEELITPTEAARLVPRARGRSGQKVSAQTVVAWMIRGVKGVYLEHLRQPRGWLTTPQAVQRFLAALAELERGKAGPAAQGPKKKSWGREFLERQGVLPRDAVPS